MEYSERNSSTVKSTSFNDDNKGKTEQDDSILKNKKKLKKLRSVKLSKSPSLKPSSTITRKSKSHLRNTVVDLPSGVENPISTLSKKQEPILTRKYSFNKGVRTLTRMSSKKQKKPVSSRSTRPVNPSPEYDQLSLVSPSSSSSISSKSSPRNSEHSFGSGRTKKTSAGLSPLRVSTEISQFNDTSVERATCSSALRDSKMAKSVQIQCCETESEGANPDTKVCPFSYCSLHGHRHRTAPPLKRLISIRKRLLRNDRNVKAENRRDKPHRGNSDNLNSNNKVNVGVQTDMVEEFDGEFSIEEEEGVKISESNPNQTGDCDTAEKRSYELTVQKGTQSEEEERHPGGEEKENLEPGRAFFQLPPRESEPESPSNMTPRTKLKDQKYVTMWRLMYKHAVREVEDKREREEVTERVFSEDDDQDKASESYKIDAVNLVQRAFDEILLPEIQDRQEQPVGEEERLETIPDSGDKFSGQKVSKSWSSLKKIFILKKFVKAIEKVKMIKKGTPRYLPPQTEPEAERVNLRRQTSEEKKIVEDWMLDYALQQVISKLDPDQQKRVAVLVRAFETVLPDLHSPSPRPIVQNHPLVVDRSVGTEVNLSNVLTRRMTGSFETDSNQQELNVPLSSDVDDKESRETVLLGDQRGSLDGKETPNGNESFDAKKSESETKSLSLESAKETQSERQSYMRLWGFVYQHMMTNIPGEDGTKQMDETKATTTTERDESAQKAVIRRLDAIKLIEKAIDDVVLPDNQDSPSPTEGQSTGSDDEPQAKNIAVELSVDDRGNSSSGAEKCEEEVKMSAPAPLEKQVSKNWSNLKKKILLRRFIKAFDNARKFNPRGPRFLALEAEPEAEKVNLRHQEMEGRKNAEEWMVDHALQQAVARLTPARMRKVQLLVEAFETVTPVVRP